MSSAPIDGTRLYSSKGTKVVPGLDLNGIGERLSPCRYQHHVELNVRSQGCECRLGNGSLTDLCAPYLNQRDGRNRRVGFPGGNHLDHSGL